MSPVKVGLIAVWIVYLVIMALAMVINPAKAHDWYESACCSGKDCAPVPDGTVTETNEGVVVKGWGVLSESDQRIRWSQDERDHLCVQRPWNAQLGKLMCVYRKRKFM